MKERLARLGLHLRAPDARPIGVVQAEIDEELAFHLDASARELVRAGAEPKEAACEARRRFGDLADIRRACRRQKLGERIVIQRIQMVLILLLVLSVGVLAQQWSSTSRQQQDAIHALRNHVAELSRGTGGLAQAAPTGPVEHVIYAVGDRLRIANVTGNHEPNVHATVARDGKILLPEIGWVDIAGKAREDVEGLLTKTYLQYYEHADIKIVLEGSQAVATPPIEHVFYGVGDRLKVVNVASTAGPDVLLTVAADGKVLLPDVGWIDVAGETREAVEALLTERYEPYYEDVDIKVVLDRSPRAQGRGLAGPVEHIVYAVGDRLLVANVAGGSEPAAQPTVARDGKILLPELGWVHVAGETREDAEALLTKSYRPFYTDVDIKIVLAGSRAGAPAPVAHIVYSVGDRLKVTNVKHRGGPQAVQTVARDGKILLPELGWVHVAGETREDVEALLTKSYEPFYTDIDIKIVSM
ncbi:MAG: hypothetical protein GY711_23870 [bacterium]|nr:hypothetical protein [bacterium]